MVPKMIDDRSPAAPVSSVSSRLVAIEKNAKIQILRSGDWISLPQASQSVVIGLDERTLQEWVRTDRVFALSHEGNIFVPVYGFDSTTHNPLAGLEAVVAVLKTHNNAWDMAYWFASPNNFLGGSPPKALLASAPERLLSAAFEEVGGVMHG